jgi:hypothetical protein
MKYANLASITLILQLIVRRVRRAKGIQDLAVLEDQ